MEIFKKAYRKIVADFRKLPERKQYVEFFTAILTVPVLLTVIILNITNLRSANEKKEETKPEQPVREIIITQPVQSGEPKVMTVTTEPCEAGIGEISIDYPSEGETVTDNPVQFGITYKAGEYCAVVWSYRINNGRWSDYDDRSVALYNLPQGNVKFDLRVKSVVSGEEKSLTRSFAYRGTADTTPSPTASSSAN